MLPLVLLVMVFAVSFSRCCLLSSFEAVRPCAGDARPFEFGVALTLVPATVPVLALRNTSGLSSSAGAELVFELVLELTLEVAFAAVGVGVAGGCDDAAVVPVPAVNSNGGRSPGTGRNSRVRSNLSASRPFQQFKHILRMIRAHLS
jgi:hypothetical protein